MFGTKKTEDNGNGSKKTILPSSNSGGINSLVQNTRVTGDVTSSADIRIDGYLKGTLDCKAKVIIGATGEVDGNIKCINAVIEGVFSGDLSVEEILDIRRNAKISGNIHTDKLIVESGATFNVNCSMGGLKKGKLKTKPAAVLAEN